MNMIRILYKDPLCCSMNYGFTSEWWSPQRAIRQGCGVSPLLYDITVEVLLCYLHDESKINFQGLTLCQIKHKLAAFADNLHLYINIESDSLEEITTAFDNFERCTGLKVSYDKSSLYRMFVEDGNAQMYTTKLIKWDHPPFRMLGVNIDFDAKQMSIDYFNCVLEKVRNTCKLWSNRNLSLIGKIKIVNNLMTSQYVYQMISLNLISDEHVKEFNQTINNYLWKNRKPKIPLKVLQLPVTDGGLGLIDIRKKDIAMKVQWVKCMIKEDNIKDLALELLPGIGSDIWKCNLNQKDTDDMIHMESFWKQVLKCWTKVNYKKQMIDAEDCMSQFLWYNSHIRKNNKPFWYKNAMEKGCNYIYQLLDEHGEFISFERFQMRFGNDMLSFMQYYSLISAIPRDWHTQIRNNNYILVQPVQSLFDKLVKGDYGTKLIYLDLNTSKKELSKMNEKWNRKLKTNIEYNDFVKIVRCIPEISQEVCLQSF